MRDHPQLRIIIKSFRDYLDSRLDIDGLQQNLAAVAGGMESDLPHEVRQQVFTAEGEIELIRFTVDEGREAVEVAEVLREFEEVLARYEGSDSD